MYAAFEIYCGVTDEKPCIWEQNIFAALLFNMHTDPFPDTKLRLGLRIMPLVSFSIWIGIVVPPGLVEFAVPYWDSGRPILL